MIAVGLVCLTAGLIAPPHAVVSRHRTPLRAASPQCKLFSQRPVTAGTEWDGVVNEITNYGCFVRMGHEQYSGLVHISTLLSESKKRVRPEDVKRHVEAEVGPVGTPVRVMVIRTTFKGKPQIGLQFLNVIVKEDIEDVVFAGRLRDD